MKVSAKKSNVKISFQEKILFTKHLSTMYKAGIPLPEIIETLIQLSKTQSFKAVLKGVLAEVENGQSLSKALSAYPRIFDEFYISLIQISEESGTLEDNLNFLSIQLTKDFNLRKKVISALLYPGIILFAMTVLGGFVSFFILPRLVEFFESFDIELPLTTKILLFLAKTMQNYGLVIALFIIAVLILFRLLLRLKTINFYWHVLMLRLPLVGKLISYGQIARFSRNLGTLVQSGIPIVKGLEITADTLSNLKYKKDLYEVSKILSKGKFIGNALENKNYWEYPSNVSKMISVGEKSGNIDEVLMYLSDFYDNEIDDLSKNLSTVLEPILLVIMGIAVGFVALSIISPIYELTGSIRR